MQDFIIPIMDQFGYFGIAFLIAIENIFPPIPSEVILTFGGFMTTYTRMNIPMTVVASTIGSLFGALVLYGLGYLLDETRLQIFFSGRIGSILHLKPTDLKRAIHWFSEKGNKAVFLCRFVPLLRSIISIPAGMAKMNITTFLILTAIGSVIWNTILIYLGALAGNSWESVSLSFDKYASYGKIILVILVIFGIGTFYYKRLKSEKKL